MAHIDYFHKLKFLRKGSQERRHRDGKLSPAGSQGTQAPSSTIEHSPPSGSVTLPVSPPNVKVGTPIHSKSRKKERNPNKFFPITPLPNEHFTCEQISPPTPMPSASLGIPSKRGKATAEERLALLRSTIAQERLQSKEEKVEDNYIIIEQEYFMYTGGPDWIACNASEFLAKLPALPPPRLSASYVLNDRISNSTKAGTDSHDDEL